MKKQMKMAAMLVAGAMMLAACGAGDFKTTDSGLMYKFEKQNKTAQQVQEGDVLVGEMTIRFDTTETFSNVGHADRIMQATKTFDGDLYEGLLMMHVGDKATFAIEADTLAKFLQANQMPPYYQPGKGMKIYYEISLQDIVTKEEIMQEQANYMQEMQQRQQNEPEAIAAYISDNNIKEKANADGLYVIVKKKGNGPKVAAGKSVSINYTGRLLDGTMFDSSVESDARRGNIYVEGRTYEPLSYIVGQMGLIKGWEDGIMGQPEGSILQIVMPSSLGYGSRGAGEMIPPYSPLVFDIEIVSVK
ncbi:MAG: FKBP-type peptidyl-prolyl cis-trans isomerase [Bacteroidales bacterium]|nr:FKBP-type peptidyl-prolyl cis-trans isomerase [Bacteroidales bacterium]